jgi:hypothetical protein
MADSTPLTARGSLLPTTSSSGPETRARAAKGLPCKTAVHICYGYGIKPNIEWKATPRAANLGLGWVSILNPETVTAVLEVPTDWTFIGYFCLGHPQTEDETPELERLGWEVRQPAETSLIRR